MNSFRNKKGEAFLESIPTVSLESDDNLLSTQCKFNFGYFDLQPAGQNFSDWTHVQLLELMDKLKEYSKLPLQHWRNCPIGKGGGTVLSIYGSFPGNSDFTHPKHVPHEAQWGRFRLSFSGRLVGFIVPSNLHDLEHKVTKKRLDANTFYVVFLDANHRFAKGKEAK